MVIQIGHLHVRNRCITCPLCYSATRRASRKALLSCSDQPRTCYKPQRARARVFYSFRKISRDIIFSLFLSERNASSQQSDTHQKSLHDDDQGIAHPDSLDRDFKITEQIAALLAIQKESKLAPLGHQFSSMIRSCRYKGVNCRLANTMQPGL